MANAYPNNNGKVAQVDRRRHPRFSIVGCRARIDAGPTPLGVIRTGGEGGDALRADHVLELGTDPRAYARLLYAALHTLDELGCARILVEAPPDEPGWAAIHDRLTRASA